MDIFKDKVLLTCLIVAFLATGFLFFKKFSLIFPPQGETSQSPLKSSLSDKADKIHKMAVEGNLPATTEKTAEAPSTETEDLAKTESVHKSLIEADEKAMADAVPVEPVVPAPAPDPNTAAATQVPPPKQGAFDKVAALQNAGFGSGTPSQNTNQVMVKKSRPRMGKNEWLVGPGAGADSTDLEPILKNVSDGDIVTISPGVYEFSLSMVGGSVELHGREGVSLKFKKSFSPVMVNAIILKDVKLEIEPEDNFITIQSPRLKLTMDNVTITEEKQTISFNKGTTVEVKNSHFTGTTFAFWDMTQATFDNCFFEKGSTFISLYGSSKVKVNKSQLMNFSGNAISSHSYLTRFEAENLKVSTGTSAFFGKFTAENTNVRDSEFKSLSYFTMQPETKINCSICQKTNIKN